MLPYPNLVSDSLLVNSTIDFLISVGGSAPAVNVVDHVMRIRDPHPDFARVLIADVIDRDPRLELVQVGDSEIDGHESIPVLIWADKTLFLKALRNG